MLRLSGLVVGDTLSHVLGSQVVTPATFYAETWIAVDSAAANAISATTTLVNILACMIASPFFLSWLVRDRVRFPVWLVVETRGACGECCLNDVRAIGVCGEDVLASVNEHAENDVRAARETSAARTRSTGVAQAGSTAPVGYNQPLSIRMVPTGRNNTARCYRGEGYG